MILLTNYSALISQTRAIIISKCHPLRGDKFICRVKPLSDVCNQNTVIQVRRHTLIAVPVLLLFDSYRPTYSKRAQNKTQHRNQSMATRNITRANVPDTWRSCSGVHVSLNLSTVYLSSEKARPNTRVEENMERASTRTQWMHSNTFV